MVKHLLAVVLSAATLAGCNVSGVAEKGPFQEGSTVTASVLRNDASLSSALSIQSAVTDALGSYRIESDISWNVWIQLEASGSYFNELTGVVSEDALALKATTLTNGSFSRANINLFSHLVTARFQQRVSDGLNLRRAYNRSERDLRNVFGISRRSTALSVADGRSRRRQDNANLALFSGALLSLPDTAVALDNLTQDFADDGLFNGVGEATFAAIALKSAEEGLLTTIRDNLIANGASNPPDEDDLGELPEWVDTEGEPPVEVNTAPVVFEQSVEAVEDTTIDVSLVAIDADGDALSFTVGAAANGEVSVAGNVATYIPNDNFYGTDSFTFTVSDGELRASETVSLNVAAVDDLPTAEDIEAGVVSVGESISITLVGADIDSEISFTATDGSLGSVIVNDLGESGVQAIYTAGFVGGEDSFSYQVTGSDQSATATVSVVVEAPVVPQGTLQGSVRDVSGNLISDVTIEVTLQNFGLSIDDVLIDQVIPQVTVADTQSGSILTSSDESGQFVLTADANSAGVVTLRKDGYADQVVPVFFLEGTAPINVVMTPRGEVQIIDASEGGSVIGADDATVFITPNLFVDASGNVVTGEIEVTITPLDVSNKATLAAFPGDFYGIVGGSEVEIGSDIATLGTTEFVFTQDGQPLSVAPEQLVDIKLPIYNTVNPATGLTISEGERIALWSLNESTGIWLQEGEGVVVESRASPTGFALAAQVSHFTWWNVDVAIDPIDVTALINPLLLDDGTEIESDIATLHVVSASGFGWRPSQLNTVMAVGESLNVRGLPSNTNLCFWAEYATNTGGIFNSDQQCIDTQSFQSYDLVFDATVSSDGLGLAVLNTETHSIGKAITPVQIVSTTLESAVDYAVVGELPLGLSLVQVNAVKAEIQGVPPESGSFLVTVEGADSDGNVSRVDHTLVVGELEAPVLQGDGFGDSDEASVFIYQESGLNEVGLVTVDLSQYNIGGVASSWSYAPDEGIDEVNSISISDEGLLVFTHGSEPYEGKRVSETLRITASNSEGNSNQLEVMIDLYFTEFSFNDCIDVVLEDNPECLIFIVQ